MNLTDEEKKSLTLISDRVKEHLLKEIAISSFRIKENGMVKSDINELVYACCVTISNLVYLEKLVIKVKDAA